MDKLILTTQEEIRLMTDPYRIDIIQILRKHKDVPLTVKDIAQILHEPHGKVYYHVQKLFKFGALRIERTEKINGIVAKYYMLNFNTMEIQSNREGIHNEVSLNHAMTMINKFYDDSKKEFLNYVKNAPKHRTNLELDRMEHPGKIDSTLQSTSLFFTEESYASFMKTLNELINDHTQETKVEGEFEKSIFLTIYNEYNETSNLMENKETKENKDNKEIIETNETK